MHRARLISSPDGLHRHGNFRLTGHLLPLLEELDIDVCNDDGNPLLAPSLWRLSIRTIPWNITAPHLRLLKVALNDRVECFNPYFAQIPKLLSAIPLLESFSFKLTAQYGLYEGEEGFSSAVHGARRSIQGVLTALDQGKPAVDMRHLKVMTIEANTRGSSQGQFAALLTTMLWRCLDASHLGDIRIVLSEQFHPLSELLDTMQKHVSSPRVDVLTITYQWPSLEFTLTNSNPDEASHCTFRLPSCDRTSFLDGIVYFSRDASRQLKTLRLVSLSTPGPDLGGQIGFRPRSGAYPSIESIEVYGPASLLTRVLWMYTFPQLQTIALHAPQHDHHELAGLAGELRGRPAKLKQFTLRGHTAYIDETKFAREIWALRLVDPAEVVIDEREGPETGSSHSRVFKAGGSHVSSTTRTQKPGAAGRAAAPVSAAARRRTDSIVGEVSARGARRSTESSTNGRSTWR
ncbi:unnamed protein product [Peniophora sp. CBMAI 1063]|nr:unnamed protein product [Peniophora sp. CBMAI 1063]